MELLLVLNKLGAEVEEGRVVESVVGLLTMKENAGLGAAEESVALCPKEKVGFGASAEEVSFFSDCLPKGYAGGGGCVSAPGLLKEKPAGVAAAGAASASLLAAPKTKAEGAEAAASFFSSGFPKVNVGAAGCLSACIEPNVVPPWGVVMELVVELDSPNPPKTEVAVFVVVVDEVVSDDAVFDDVIPSLFPSEETGGMKLTEDEVVVSDAFSSGFDSPKVKPVLEELLSVLEDDPLPNTIPPLVPNLDQPAAGSGSDVLSSLEADPNLKPSDELPNLNPDAAVLSLDAVSEAVLPNLNPPEDEEDSETKPPILKPDPDPELLSDVPNLKPPELESEVLSDVPNLKPPVELNVAEPAADEANDELKALGSTLAPGLVA